MTDIERIYSYLTELEGELADEEDQDQPETISEWQAERDFEELLGEVYGTVEICGYTFDAGRALRELDPIAFREGMLCHYDAEGIEID